MLFELFIVLSFGLIILIIPTFNLFDGGKQKKYFSNKYTHFLIRLPHIIISIVIPNIIISPLISLRIIEQLSSSSSIDDNDARGGGDSFNIFSDNIFCIITSTILLCFIKSLKKLNKIILSTKRENKTIFNFLNIKNKLIQFLILILIYPLSTIYVHILLDKKNYYSGITDCFYFLIGNGFTYFFNGIHFYFIRILLEELILKILKFNLYKTNNSINEEEEKEEEEEELKKGIHFWKNIFFESICLLIVSLLTYPLLTIQLNLQMLIQQNLEIKINFNLFNGIQYLPFIIFIESLFKNIFESFVKNSFHFKFSNIHLNNQILITSQE